MLRRIGILAFAALGASCADVPTSPAVVDAPVGAARSSSAPVHRVSGGGRLDLGPLGLADEQYGFTASLDGDGVTRGQIQGNLTVPDVAFHGEVACLSVLGRDAWMRFVVTHGTPALPAGTPVVFMVRDNGPGGSGEPDQMSFFFVNGGSQCDFHGSEPDLLEWKHGDIRVD